MNLQKEWQVCDGPAGYQHRIVAGDVVICDVVETRDARLIASAHAMFAAILDAIEAIEDGDAQSAARGLTSVLAKARGEAQ